MLGKLFVETFKNGRFTVNEYNSLMFSIELINPFEGFFRLREFYEYKQRMDNAGNDSEKRSIWTEGAKLDYQPLAYSGLLNLPYGGAYAGNLGGAYINERGIKFYEYVVVGLID